MKKPTPIQIARESRGFIPDLGFLSNRHFHFRVERNPEHAHHTLEDALAKCRATMAGKMRRVDVSTPEQADPSSHCWLPATRFTVYGRTDEQLRLEEFLAWRAIVFAEKRDARALGTYEPIGRITPREAVLHTKRLPPNTVRTEVEVTPDECPAILRTDPSEDRVRAMFAAALGMECLLSPTK